LKLHLLVPALCHIVCAISFLNFLCNPEVNRRLEVIAINGRIMLKCIRRIRCKMFGLYFSDSEWGPVMDCSEYTNRAQNFIN
jgi:hypothetical protein